MIKMVMNPGDEEQVYDLTETPDFLLLQFCESILRKQDLRNPEVQNMLGEIVDALRAKVDNKSKDGFGFLITVDRNELKGVIQAIDGLLMQIKEEQTHEPT
jgi:hypothetical protein